jgi:hypothetical protein
MRILQSYVDIIHSLQTLQHAPPADVTGNVYHTIAWQVTFKSSQSGARLFITLSSSAPYEPPPPPPPPPPSPLPPCTKALCGSVQQTSGDVSLTAAGGADWAHFGMPNVQVIILTRLTFFFSLLMHLSCCAVITR